MTTAVCKFPWCANYLTRLTEWDWGLPCEKAPSTFPQHTRKFVLNNKEGPRQSGAVDTADCNWNSVYAAVWNAPLTSPHAPQNEKEVPLFARFRPSIHISIIFQTEWQTSRKEETCRLWKPAVNGPATLLLNEPTVSLSSAVKKH